MVTAASTTTPPATILAEISVTGSGKLKRLFARPGPAPVPADGGDVMGESLPPVPRRTGERAVGGPDCNSVKGTPPASGETSVAPRRRARAPRPRAGRR